MQDTVTCIPSVLSMLQLYLLALDGSAKRYSLQDNVAYTFTYFRHLYFIIFTNLSHMLKEIYS